MPPLKILLVKMNKPVNPNMSINSCAIGIDFGTTNSAMSRFSDTLFIKGPISLNFPLTGSALYPSAAYLDEEISGIRTGLVAYNKRHIEPERVVLSVKRHIADNTVYHIKNKTFSNTDIVRSIISDFIKEIMLTDHEFQPNFIAVTVPYYFGENENAFIKFAADEAIRELSESEITVFTIPEPVAASLSCIFNLNIRNIEPEVFLIYDIGGGTLDLTLVRVMYNAEKFSYEVLANDGISKFGGDDIDDLIYDYVLNNIEIDDSNLTDHQQRLNKARLLNECKEAKHNLSFCDNYTLVCNNIYGIESGTVEICITQDVLNDLLCGRKGSKRNMMREFQNCIENLYAKAHLSPAVVKYTVPVGGTSFIPLFRTYINSIHCSAQEVASGNINDNLTLVANGASIYAAMKSDEICGTKYHPFDSNDSIENIRTRISHSLYIEKFNGKFDLIIPANSVSPFRICKRYFPAKLSKNGDTVELTKVRLFQGEGASRKCGKYIGMIDFSEYEIFAHGRTINEIPIDITIEATDTLVRASCFIPQSDSNGNDLAFTQIIHD